jgi:hypothetical protein
MTPGEKPESPIWMALVPVDPKIKNMVVFTLASIAPVAIAILMQKPQLRQAIAMRTMHTSKVICQDMADMFQTLANHSATAYQKAQL